MASATGGLTSRVSGRLIVSVATQAGLLAQGGAETSPTPGTNDGAPAPHGPVGNQLSPAVRRPRGLSITPIFLVAVT